MSNVESNLLGGRVLASELAGAPPRRDFARVMVAAAEVCLLSRDPHLAARAAWVALRSGKASQHEYVFGERAVAHQS